jgi:hypothetical protein
VCAVLDDLVVALYVTVDGLPGKRSRPGRPPRLSDAELVCLAVAQVLLGCNSERRWLRFVGHRLRHLFPYVPGKSGYNRRLLDATPVPCGARGRRSSAVTWPAGPATAMSGATRAGIGASSCTCWRPRTA